MKGSIALVLSVIAFAVAVSGTAAVAGGLIDGSQIVDHSIHKSKLAKDARAKRGKRGPRGFRGAQGVAGAQGVPGSKGDTGPQGPKGDPGTIAPAASYGVATVNVKRGSGPYSAWATYSTPLGSPVGDTTGGTFRFTCSTGNAPCLVKVAAAVLGGSDHSVYPRLLLDRQDYSLGGPAVYCEYGDGSTGSAPFPLTAQPLSATPTYTYMPINIGGSDDCNTPPGPSDDVAQISVPAGYYNVHATFAFLP